MSLTFKPKNRTARIEILNYTVRMRVVKRRPVGFKTAHAWVKHDRRNHVTIFFPHGQTARTPVLVHEITHVLQYMMHDIASLDFDQDMELFSYIAEYLFMTFIGYTRVSP